MTLPLTPAQYDKVDFFLGHPGRMISGNKSHPRGKEDHVIYWNACVFAKTGRKDAAQIWYGDLNVTEQSDAIQALATKLDKTLYATPEQPWRFDGFKASMKRRIQGDRPVYTFEP